VVAKRAKRPAVSAKEKAGFRRSAKAYLKIVMEGHLRDA